MRRTTQTRIASFLFTVLFTAAAALLTGQQLYADDKAPPAKPKQLPYSTTEYTFSNTQNAPPPGTANPAPDKAAAVMEKLKNLGAHLGRALDIAVDLFSGNEAELLSGNKTALLSGNKPNILSGNKTKLLSDNTTPILSGNTFEVLSNIKIEIHIENSGNTMAAPSAQPRQPITPTVPAPATYSPPPPR